jgi:hypothetical protein
MSWADRALIAALIRRLPGHRQVSLLVTPATILRRHRRLVARRWTTILAMDLDDAGKPEHHQADTIRVRRPDRLGGLIHEYQQVA